MSDNRKRYRETGAAPLNYVAGLGRGATGFTTRSDIGPARVMPAFPGAAPGAPGAPTPAPPPAGGGGRGVGVPAPDFGAAPAGYVAGGGRGFGGREYTAAEGEEKERLDYSESSYDEFGGYSHSITASDPYEQDDEEADMLWLEVDKRMEERRKQRREGREAQAAAAVLRPQEAAGGRVGRRVGRHTGHRRPPRAQGAAAALHAGAGLDRARQRAQGAGQVQRARRARAALRRPGLDAGRRRADAGRHRHRPEPDRRGA